MSALDDAERHLRRLVADEPVRVGDHEVLGPLERLCRVAARELGSSGAGVGLMWGDEGRVLVAASDDDAARLEEVQFLLGEGPCRQAFSDREPVLVPDLATSTRFPAYARQALALGVRAVFAFPIWEQGACIGVLDVYRTEADALDDTHVRVAGMVVALVREELAVVGHRADGTRVVLGELALDPRDHLFMAQGMVMEQLGLDPSEAMARLRAAAFVHDQPLLEIARAVLSREVVLRADGA